MKTVEQTELHNYKKIEEAYKALKEVETPFLPTGMAKLTLKLKEELFILHRESEREIKFKEEKRKALEEELSYMKQFNEEQIELHKKNMEYKDEEQAVGNYYKKERKE